MNEETAMFRPADRRTHERVEITRPCKLHDLKSGKYVPGTTCNVSPGGALVMLNRAVDMSPGDSVAIGIDVQRRGLIKADEMMDAKVVRYLSTNPRHSVVAVQFSEDAGAAVEVETKPDPRTQRQSPLRAAA